MLGADSLSDLGSLTVVFFFFFFFSSFSFHFPLFFAPRDCNCFSPQTFDFGSVLYFPLGWKIFNQEVRKVESGYIAERDREGKRREVENRERGRKRGVVKKEEKLGKRGEEGAEEEEGGGEESGET